MSDSATLNHAARVLTSVSARLPADMALRGYFAAHRHIRPTQKRAISRALFTYYRWLKWLDRDASAQKKVEGALLLQTRFEQNPASIKTEALAARAVPDWLKDEVELPLESLRLLQREPVLWIRARPGQAEALARSLQDCEPPSPAALSRVGQTVSSALRYTGEQDLFLTPQFHDGEFEIQDLASQMVGVACAPKPGQTWWDACAGEGGKLLHLADLMRNKGLIWASDRSLRRLNSLKRRTARAKLFNYRAAPWDGSVRLPTKTKFDGVLLDAPCSGVGTWQRNPHARWTTTLQDVHELAIIQRSMLEHIAPALKTGGRLVYAVCTLTRSETHDVVASFTAAHPEFAPVKVFSFAAEPSSPLSSPACALAETDFFAETTVTLWPHELNANGMFIAVWQRR